ncbi:hypothetical protein FN846DRAFT_889425 [Sphaerosporella brunnea]|uniref:Uncharacterized protein n=1 Tax=Sphaerosporella brunnea TaxID=1250544 RepID=A0A5J5EZZ9_9PEZI|nr:hypothetical protein FN846DRAFT_889425 [Sphaerosporella brunnea]
MASLPFLIRREHLAQPIGNVKPHILLAKLAVTCGWMPARAAAATAAKARAPVVAPRAAPPHVALVLPGQQPVQLQQQPQPPLQHVQTLHDRQRLLHGHQVAIHRNQHDIAMMQEQLRDDMRECLENQEAISVVQNARDNVYLAQFKKLHVRGCTTHILRDTLTIDSSKLQP